MSSAPDCNVINHVVHSRTLNLEESLFAEVRDLSSRARQSPARCSRDPYTMDQIRTSNT